MSRCIDFLHSICTSVNYLNKNLSCGIKFGTNTWTLLHFWVLHHIYVSHLTAFNAPDSNPHLKSSQQNVMQSQARNVSANTRPINCTASATRRTISAMFSSNEVAAIHDITHSLSTATCTTHLALFTTQPSMFKTILLCPQVTNTSLWLTKWHKM